MDNLYVIKIGGNVIDNSENLHFFLNDFASLDGYKILIHGGGKLATDLSHTLGIEPRLVDGRRITDIETLRVVTMVYAGLINKNIVAQLQRYGNNAIGLTGADANLIKASKRPVKEVDYGYVGDLNKASVASDKLEQLLQSGLVPVFSAITHDGEGQLLNTNADTIASAIAVAMSSSFKVSLVYCFEKKGVLRDVNDNESIIREIGSSEFEQLKSDNVIAGGMLPKLHNAFQAIQNGVSDVYIGKSDELPFLKEHLFGTRLFA
ncbi:acetylglutamate kinase [Pararcticibacter amylolyticus]|uniref:Acetylglutamate kinase n=1 Tax=Pararcticibacter amylolyticus TaxID=2173175 RepID=A0A2U2PI81_9SPHI|nr:acetylglutamate kinase [Pararcticibacter amylolyticus]PWG81113.1 acetylglutamate kinase [Pararcticibacter amylolyticus]